MLLLAGCLVFLFALVVLPARVAVRAERSDSAVAGEVSLRPLVGVFGVLLRAGEGPPAICACFGPWRIPVVRLRSHRQPQDAGKATTAQGAPDEPAEPIWDRIRSVRDQVPRYAPVAGRLLRRLRRSISLRRLWVDATYGADSPEVTGRLFGTLQALRGAAGRRVRLNVLPDFQQAGFSGAGGLEIWFHPGIALWAIGAAGLAGGRLFLGRWVRRRWMRVGA